MRQLVNDPRRPGDDPGLFIETVTDFGRFAGRPALYLDRDGVINVDTGYPSSPADITLLGSIVEPIRRANAAGWPVVVVTNQSGVAQGYLTWDGFAAITAHIHDLLAAHGVHVEAVLACAYYKGGAGVLDVADHPMRKPNPGMLLKAAELAGIDLNRSLMVGDRASDLEAAAGAGVRTGFVEDIATIGPQLAGKAITVRPFAELCAAIG